MRKLQIFAACLLLMSLTLAGCVYYNTLHNAKKLFKKAQEKELSTTGRPTGRAMSDYDKAMKKCGYILTEYKDNKYADDALFLLARCLFYRQNYMQAAEKFEDIFTFYPDSEYEIEARIYIAKCQYQRRKKSEAYTLLQQFLINPAYQEKHSMAILLLAQYYLEEKSYLNAEKYLRKLIEEHAESEEYDEAFFTLAKVHYEAGEYAMSNEVFTKLLSSGVERYRKRDAEYYMALNYIMLDDYLNAHEVRKKLQSEEYRTNVFSKIDILAARIKCGEKDFDGAIEIYERVIKDNMRGGVSAEANFRLAELYFQDLHNYEEAIKAYNKVKKTDSKSKFVKTALAKSAVASQIIQFQSGEGNIATHELVSQSFKLAEYYIDVLSLPDSALVVYENIISQKSRLIAKMDSLQIEYDSLVKVQIADSLASLSQVDSLAADSLEIAIMESDSTQTIVTKEVKIDSTKDISKENGKVSKADNNEIACAPQNTETAAEKQAGRQRKIKTQGEDIERYKKDIGLYDEEFIPFTLFIKTWLYRELKADTLMANVMLSKLETDYPQNKYTYASRDFLNNKDVEMMTPTRKILETELDTAIEAAYENPETSLEMLIAMKIADEDLVLKRNFSAGCIYYFEMRDTTSAQPLFKQIIAEHGSSEYATFLKNNKLMENGKISYYNRLPYLVKQEEEAVADSLAIIATEKAVQANVDEEVAEDGKNEDIPEKKEAEDTGKPDPDRLDEKRE